MKLSTHGRLTLCITPLLLLAIGGSGAAPAKPAPPAQLFSPLSPPQPLGDLLRTLPPQAAPLTRRTPGDVIPQCYMVYGYGTDSHGKGPFLNINGQALPIGSRPQVVPVWRFHSQADAKKAVKPLR